MANTYGLDVNYDPNLDREIEVEVNENDTTEYEAPMGTVNTESVDVDETTENEGSNKRPTTKAELDAIEPGEIIPGTLGLRKPRPGIGGFFQDFGQDLYRNMAPVVGISDTIIDTINLASAGDRYNIPKLPRYESNTVQAIRNVSGLIIPSLGLKSMAINAASKYHAAGSMATKAPWLYKLGNSASFSYFAKAGIDIGTAATVDLVAEQNQKDDNLLGTLKTYWPKTYQWVPDSIATGKDDSAGDKRSKNVAEGAIFSVLSSIIEGAAYILKGGRSISKARSKFIPAKENAVKNIEELVKDEFSDVKFSDNPVEDSILRQYARKEKELELLSAYYISKGEPPPRWDMYDEGETLVRTRDADGILGAQADAAQIQNNLESSWGRIGNLIHEAGRKEGIELQNLHNRTLVSELTDQLKNGGNFSKRLKSNKLITNLMMDRAGKKLAGLLLNPRLDTDDILGILDEFKRSVDESAVRIVGKKGITKAIKQLQQQMLDLDVQKAKAYLVTSEAGQISDMSEGARLMHGSDSVVRTIDLMADRLEVLMVEKGLANFEANAMLSHMNAWQKAVDTGDKEIINQAADTILANSDSKLTELIPKAKEWASTLKAVARENPDFLRPLLLANELTDGNIDSLGKLHNWAAENLSVFKKAIIDRNPEVPSIINKAMFSNIFNSMLSAMSTPLNAGVGNLTGLLGKGMATVTGSVLRGDLTKAKKAMVAHFALDDTLQKSLSHMRLVFRKASINPEKMSYMMRGDLAREAEVGIDALRAWSDAAAEGGEYGGQMMLKIFDDLDALSKDPLLRFGSNVMTGLDGFSKSVVAMSEAKYRAFNKLAQSGEEITDKNFQKAVNEIYDSFFDSNDMINEESINIATSEIALNQDSPIVDGMNWFIRRFPIARTFIWFPRTSANVIDTFGKWSPAGILSDDHWKMWGPLGRKKLNEFTMDEITSILRSKGKPVDEFAMETFEMLRNEVKGKAALGSLFVTMAGFAAINDRCTGNGHYQPNVQRSRIRRGWKANSCSAPGSDKQISYEWMGPLGDWLSLTVDIIDNADTLSSGVMEDLLNKSAFVFGSAFTNRSVLSQLEPLHDVLSGNGAAASRWATGILNNLVPLGSGRNEIGKILFPQLRQLRSELDDQLRNRNAWLDAFDPSRKLPSVVDPVDGNPIGDETNWFIRVWNRSPFKITEKPSKENQFLIDIEFNTAPIMRTSQHGAMLENHEITAINTEIGRMGWYKKEIRRIMKKANNLTYIGSDGITYKGFENIIRAQRRGNISSEILDTGKFANIYSELTMAFVQAKKAAENNLPEPMKSGIRQREYDYQNANLNQQKGDLETLLKDAGLEGTLNMAK